MSVTQTSWGQVAYEAYYAHCGGISVHGDQLPDWDEQTGEIRGHWEAAAQAVVQLAAMQ